MSARITIDYGNVPAVLARIKNQRVAREASDVWATYMLSRVALYAPIRKRKQPPKTDKQRRFLHWAYRTGQLQSPYRRTGGMRDAWEKRLLPDGISHEIVNETAAARYTKDSRYQSAYHKGNWPTVGDDVRRYGPEANKRALARVRVLLTAKGTRAA